MIRSRWALSANVVSRLLDLAGPLDEDPVPVVAHDFRDLVVAEQRLERPVAEDVVGQLADDPASLLAGEGRPVERKLLGNGAVHLLVQVLGRLRREELRPQLGDAGVVDAGLQLGIRVGRGRRPLVTRLRRRAANERDRRLGPGFAGGLAVLAFDAVVESHV